MKVVVMDSMQSVSSYVWQHEGALDAVLCWPSIHGMTGVLFSKKWMNEVWRLFSKSAIQIPTGDWMFISPDGLEEVLAVFKENGATITAG